MAKKQKTQLVQKNVGSMKAPNKRETPPAQKKADFTQQDHAGKPSFIQGEDESRGK